MAASLLAGVSLAAVDEPTVTGPIASPLSRGDDPGAAGIAPITSAAPPIDADAAIPPPPEAFDAAPAPAAPPPSILRAASTEPQRGVWAVVIGIDDYPGRGSDLRASVADADTVDAMLAAYGVPAVHRLVLRDTQATAAVIDDALRWLVDNAGPDATAVVFYAGHVRHLGGTSQAIVAADGQLVTDVAVADALAPLRARSTWLLVASCYAAGFDEALAPNRILTAAAGPTSLAYENAQYGNSYLVEYLVERAMLDRSAPDSVEAAFAWAHTALRRDHPNRLPVQLDHLPGELRLGARPRPVPTPTPAPTPPRPAPTTTTTVPPEEPAGRCLLSLGSLASCGRASGE